MSEAQHQAVWDRYVSHFSFTQLGWLFVTFQDAGNTEVIDNMDCLTDVVEEWLGHTWPMIIRKAHPDLMQEALKGCPWPLDFNSFIHFLSVYMDSHLDMEEHAGFDNESTGQLLELYDMHNGMTIGDGLKGKALFAVLEDLGIRFHSKEEREWYVATVTKFDRDASGTINFHELCQIIRQVINMEEEKTRRRQFDLVKESNLPFHEVEDWNALFVSKDEACRGELELGEVKDMITTIGVKWDKDMSDIIMGWIGDADVNQNGTIDFGEFCLVISKMWSANIKDIRGAARKLQVKDRTVSLRSVHGTYVAASKEGQLSALNTTAGDLETFVMKKQVSGCFCIQSRFGKFLKAVESDVDCTSTEKGTEFKLTTLEDERITLGASTSFGGNLFVQADGTVAMSDGNPALEPFTYFSVVSHEELHKKCWSKIMAPKPKALSIGEVRKRSKDKCAPPEDDPLSPGMAKTIGDLDQALEAKAMLSARGA
jgi:Ca2+-binding EF-hand superfamily protein